MKIEIEKDLYDELMGYKNKSGEMTKKLQALEEENSKLKAGGKEKDAKLKELEDEKGELVKFKEESIQAEEALKLKAREDFIDEKIEEGKILAKDKEAELAMLGFAEERGEEALEVYKKGVDSREASVDFKTYSKKSDRDGNGGSTYPSKIETTEDFNEAINFKMEAKKLSWEDARAEVEAELG